MIIKRILPLILSTVLCFTTLIACTSDAKTKHEATTKEETTETTLIEESYTTTDLFDNVFEEFSKTLGKSSLEEDKAIANSFSEYTVETTEPSHTDMGNIKIYDAYGDYVSLIYYPNVDYRETLTFISYNRNGSSISISNENHKTRSHKYTIYDVNSTEKHISVNEVNKLKKFIFADTSTEKPETDSKLDAYVKVKENMLGGQAAIEVDTNLPNETTLIVTLSNGDYEGSNIIHILNGKATTGYFSYGNAPLDKGDYTVEVSMNVGKFQSKTVCDVVGKTGENLTGDLVEKDKFVEGSYVITARLPVTIQ